MCTPQGYASPVVPVNKASGDERAEPAAPAAAAAPPSAAAPAPAAVPAQAGRAAAAPRKAAAGKPTADPAGKAATAAAGKAATAAAGKAATTVPGARPGEDLFARLTRTYTDARPGQRLAILHAGCATASDLGAADPADSGAGAHVTLMDVDHPATRQATRGVSPGKCVLGDMRTLPLPPRAFDVVQCSGLLHRIHHAELVLDRLTSAIKPGGLLLLRVCDRDSAAGFLDRVLPQIARRAVWRRRHPGEPGPYPAVYEKLASERGVQAFALLRGLVVAERLALGGLAGGGPPGPAGFLAAQKLIARLSRGKLTAAHEELLYVLRKPENRFARVL
jgi:SAM-dependent methyltransferase